jgi:hypothetical protein
VSDATRSRVLALIGPIAGERRAAHSGGYPLAPEKMLPEADVLLLIPGDDSGAMLFRYTAHGEFAGDTWHATAADARDLAAHEYGTALGEWVAVPEAVSDAHEYAVRYAHDRLNSRGDW